MSKLPRLPLVPNWRRFAGAAVTVTTAAIVLAILVRPTQDAVANGETRSLNLVNMHTGEKLNVTFKRGGQYDSQGLKKLNYFLRDWRRDEPTRMDPRLFDTVWMAYRSVGGREPIHVVSAYRSPETNASLRRRSRGVAKFSQHTLGKAMDFYVPGVQLSSLRAAGLRLQRGGVGFYPTSGSPFVHMDAGSVRMWPKMSRAQLAAVFPDGKTVHIPSDGKPMPGFQAAFAELKRGGGSTGGFQGRSDEDGGPDGSFSIASLFGGGSSTTSPRKNADSPQAVLLADAARRANPQDKAPVQTSARSAPVPVAVGTKTEAADEARQAPVPAPVVQAEKPVAAKPVVVARADIPLPERRPNDLGPAMAWQTGPQAAADADVPLPPTRPGEPAPVVVAAAVPPTPPVAAVPDETASTQPVVRPRLPVMAGVTGGIEALLPRQLAGGGGSEAPALGYAPAVIPAAALVARFQPVALVATRFEDLDFASVSAPGSALRDGAQASLTRPDLDTFATLIPKPSKLVVIRFGVSAYQDLRAERFSGAAIKPLRTASYVASPQIFSQSKTQSFAAN